MCRPPPLYENNILYSNVLGNIYNDVYSIPLANTFRSVPLQQEHR